MSQFRVEAELETFRPDDGGLTGFYLTPVTSLLVEPQDPTLLAGEKFDVIGAVVIDLDDVPELRGGQVGVRAILTFLDGTEARAVITTDAGFFLRLGSRRVGTGVVVEVLPPHFGGIR